MLGKDLAMLRHARNLLKQFNFIGSSRTNVDSARKSSQSGVSAAGSETDPKLRILDSEWGHAESVRLRRPVDQFGRPLPWYTYPAIEYLSQFDFSNSRLFEWGAGNSSLFWSERFTEVISVERSAEWYAEVKTLAPKNLRLLHIDSDPDYANAISDCGVFDVIAIDGSQRFACVDTAIRCLRHGGIIVLDNSDWYSVAASRLRNSGLFQVDFFGFGPVNNYTWVTSIYFSGNVLLSAQKRRQPTRPIGSLKVDAEEERGLDGFGA